MRLVAPRLIALAAAAALGAAAPGSSEAQTVVDPDVSVSQILTGLDQPTGLRFLGPDDYFVIEKNSGLVKRVQGGTPSAVLDLTVSNNSERGLLGIELHPDLDSNGFVHLYYSVRDDSSDGSGMWEENQLSRFTWDGTSLGSETLLFSIPDDPPQDDGPSHNGGPLLFGPDGLLYLQTGDLNRDRAEQNDTGQANASAGTGGIYRFEDDGSVPAGNPSRATPTPTSTRSTPTACATASAWPSTR